MVNENTMIKNTLWICLMLATAFLLFGVCDGVTTYFCMEKLGANNEVSPLFSNIGLKYGSMTFLYTKIAIVSMVLIGVYAFLQEYPLYQYAIYLGMFLSGLLVSISNLVTYSNLHTELWMVQASYVLAVAPTVLATGYYVYREASKRVSHSGGLA